jgi:hypothetical protein
VLVIVFSSLAATAPTAGTAALPSPEAQEAYVEVVAVEQAMDAARRPTGPKIEVFRERHAVEATASAPALERRSAARGNQRALQAASGCKNVWVTRIGKSLFGFTIWKYTQEKYFCWTYPRVTVVQTNAYPCCTDPTWHWVGQLGSAGWFFAWAGDSRGGHYTFRQGRFEQRFAAKTWDSAQPWTRIWAYGNGSWAYDSGS